MRDQHDEPEAFDERDGTDFDGTDFDGAAELERVRALWGALDAPAPDDSDAALEVSRDPRADEAVHRMRAVWMQLEAPPAELPWRLRRRSTAAVLVALAAAAALLAGVAIGLTRRDEHRNEEPVADVGDAPTSETTDSAPNDTPSDTVIETPSDAPPHVAANEHRDEPRAEIGADGRLVLRRGAVRLMWLEPQPPATPADTDTNTSTQS